MYRGNHNHGESSGLGLTPTRRRHWLTLALVVLVMVMLTASLAQAWGLQEEKKTEKAINPNKMPAMQFVSGLLSRDQFGNWKLNQYDLRFEPGCEIGDADRPGEAATLRGGESLMLMGHVAGSTFFVRAGYAVGLGGLLPASGSNVEVEWSEVDSSVGVGEGPQ